VRQIPVKFALWPSSCWQTIPVLNVTDIGRSLAFYRDRLGFVEDFSMGMYAGVSRDGMTLHLDSGEHEFSARPTCCGFHIKGVDEFYAQIEPRGVIKPDERLEDRSHHMRQFSVLDPDGNRITFAQPIG
jgi:catechol 2,3-dioxygenase-like lactoylglutathione lyase family enzyme